MANALYAKGREGFLAGEIDFDTAVIKAALVSGYTADLATHKFVSDVTTAGGTLVATATLSPKTITDGTADAGDVTYSAVAAGDPIEHILVFQASAVTGGADVAASAQRVIALYDSSTGVALPVTPNGGDITVQWDSGANKMFTL